MSDSQTNEYVAEFIDGPLQGTTEHRLLIQGKYDDRFGALAAIEGLESTFWYRAEGVDDVDGLLHVRYSFEADGSDPVEAEDDEESISYP